VAGPLEVFVDVSTQTVSPGSVVSADVALVNSSLDFPLQGALRAELVFADGTRQALRLPQPLRLDPDSAILYQVFLPLPEDASLGTATLAFTARVGYRPAPGAPLRSHVARDTDTFEVVAP